MRVAYVRRFLWMMHLARKNTREGICWINVQLMCSGYDRGGGHTERARVGRDAFTETSAPVVRIPYCGMWRGRDNDHRLHLGAGDVDFAGGGQTLK